MALELRIGGPDDAADMARTLDEGFWTYKDFAPAAWHPPLSVTKGVERIAERLGQPGAWVLLAEDDGARAGHVALRPHEESDAWGYLWQLFVVPKQFGTGLAQRLHAAAIDEMAGRGYERATLVTPAGQARARAFYEREGWEANGTEYVHPELRLPVLEYAYQLVR